MTAETFVADSLVLLEYTLNYYKKQHAAIHTLDKYLTEKGMIREGYKKNELRRSRGGSHTNHIINNTKTNNQSLLST